MQQLPRWPSSLDIGYGDDPASLNAKLLPLAGVGPWTAGYLAMRVLGAPDVFLATDAAVRNGIKALERGADPASGANDAGTLNPDFREVSPWRSYATMHLWRAAAHPAAAPAKGTPAVPGSAGSRTAEKANQ